MKYQMMEEQMIRMIESGQGVDAGGRFLSERTIAEMFGVSRSTARKTVGELCKKGYLYQLHGSGTFVKQSKDFYSLNSITRCSQNFELRGLSHARIVLGRAVSPANGVMAERLSVPEGSRVLRLKILFKADRIVYNQTISYISLLRFPKLEWADFDTLSITETIEKEYGITPQQTSNSIEAILPSVEVTDNLKISTGTPIILFESVTSGISNGESIPLEYFKCYYRTDRFRFSFVQNHNDM